MTTIVPWVKICEQKGEISERFFFFGMPNFFRITMLTDDLVDILELSMFISALLP